MTRDEAMARLEAAGSEKVREMNVRNGAGPNQFGVKMGDIRALAKEIKTDHELGLELWKTGNLEAMFLAALIMKPKQISADDLSKMVSEAGFSHLADWLNTNILKLHPQKEDLRQKWMNTDDVMQSRAGWSLTAERIAKSPDGLDLVALLDRIESEMSGAPAPAQWTMNYCLAEIGIRFPEHRARALAIGENLGVYKDFPCSKGCTSPYAPIWIAEMVGRQG